ncbi:hypothetical protein J3Q64DRAFT_1740436 [Phycomyces blakesleeanus]|uniref:DUF3020 domain-containing protein n=1 Tax=Phycomyces blakesleeanus TaxID=4837 RepID=A0ABR3B052_PHYBL
MRSDAPFTPGVPHEIEKTVITSQSTETPSSPDKNTTPAPENQILSSPAPSNSDLTNLNLNSAHLQHMDAAQAQAIAQAAAAAMAAHGSHYHQLFTSFDPNTTQHITDNSSTVLATSLATDFIKRELINQKVRADNRDRKKRWRALNEERNKDNDLRCRVNKRANKLFGKDDIGPKRHWVEEEFVKRQAKRKEKERRKRVVDGTVAHTPTDYGLDITAATQQLTPQQLQILQETNYLSLICSNLGALSPNTASKLLGVEQGSTNPQDKTQHLSSQLIEFLQQLQQYQPPQTVESSVPQPSGTPTLNTAVQDTRPEEKVAALLSSSISSIATAVESQDKDKKDFEEQDHVSASPEQPRIDYPMDAVLTLMQLNSGWRQ